MASAGLGWFLARRVGVLAGWIASSLMKTNTGLFLNIVPGVVGGGARISSLDSSPSPSAA